MIVDILRVEFNRWEGDEYVVTVNGKPIGQTLHKADAKVVSKWLRTAALDLQLVPLEEKHE